MRLRVQNVIRNETINLYVNARSLRKKKYGFNYMKSRKFLVF